MFEGILVSVDGSENAEIVFPYSADLASRFASTVSLAVVSEYAILYIDHLYRTYLKHAKYCCLGRSRHHGVAQL